jgi:hypothetical protein
MMVEIYPNLKEEVDGSTPGYEISSLLHRKLVRWSTASCALALASQPSASKKEKKGIHASPHQHLKVKNNHSKQKAGGRRSF